MSQQQWYVNGTYALQGIQDKICPFNRGSFQGLSTYIYIQTSAEVSWRLLRCWVLDLPAPTVTCANRHQIRSRSIFNPISNYSHFPEVLRSKSLGLAGDWLALPLLWYDCDLGDAWGSLVRGTPPIVATVGSKWPLEDSGEAEMKTPRWR